MLRTTWFEDPNDIAKSVGRETLRAVLRRETRELHDALDARIGVLDLGSHDDYARFLQIQLAGRQPVENWLSSRADAPDLPNSTATLGRDLEAIGGDAPSSTRAFAPPHGCDAIGAAWVLAGSSLGNRAMLRDLDRREARPRSTLFLADPAMTEAFGAMREAIERPVEHPERAVVAARAVFDHFLAVCDRLLPVAEAA